MLTTIAIAVLAGIFLVHVLESATKAAAIVVVFLGVLYLARGVSFEALVNEGARALYDDAPSCHAVHPTHSFRL